MDQQAQINQLVQDEKYAEALALLENELSSASSQTEKPRLLALMAHCHYRLAHFAEAVALLQQAIALAPEQAQLYSERGVALFMLGDRNASLQDFNKAQELEPENPYRYSSRAYVKDAFGDTKGAIDDYQKALSLDPQDAISYNNLGLLLEKLGYIKEAQKHFSKADELEGRTAKQPSTQATAATKANVTSGTATEKAVPGAPKQKQALSLRYLGDTVKSIFTTRKGFQEFLQYWLGKKPE